MPRIPRHRFMSADLFQFFEFQNILFSFLLYILLWVFSSTLLLHFTHLVGIFMLLVSTWLDRFRLSVFKYEVRISVLIADPGSTILFACYDSVADADSFVTPRSFSNFFVLRPITGVLSP